jgi:hypothetical protein
MRLGGISVSWGRRMRHAVMMEEVAVNNVVGSHRICGAVVMKEWYIRPFLAYARNEQMHHSLITTFMDGFRLNQKT